ncbi:MAG TPA: hypothetical protein ENI75_01160 [Mizugakiibacter sp.]|nr:hypothetical protein [Mizugakiibacter sp.]
MDWHLVAKKQEAVTWPHLQLSGSAIDRGFNSLLAKAEESLGIDAYLRALQLKSELFSELLNTDRLEQLNEKSFLAICTFMSTVRRRIGAWLDKTPFNLLQDRLLTLLDTRKPGAQRFEHFVASFPSDRTHRWIRDLAAEILHFTEPEKIPLMARWLWDAQTGSGVIREIWFDQAIPLDTLALDDHPATFFALNSELKGFLDTHGIYRDRIWMQDLLYAHLYAAYINNHGAIYLKCEFTGEVDPMAHTQRLLGLDCFREDGIHMKVKLPSRFSANSVPPPQLTA